MKLDDLLKAGVDRETAVKLLADAQVMSKLLSAVAQEKRENTTKLIGKPCFVRGASWVGYIVVPQALDDKNRMTVKMIAGPSRDLGKVSSVHPKVEDVVDATEALGSKQAVDTLVDIINRLGVSH